jgi:CBS domain containing-hemolysin-like protein
MDESGLGIVFQVAVVFLLVFANGFFVAAEFSLVTVRRSRVEELVNAGSRGAGLVADILKDLDTVISSTQLGITMASLALGWVAEPFLAHLIEPWLSFLPTSVVLPAAHSLAVALAFILITYLHIVLGELAPKTLALQRAESTALAIAGPMIIFARVFRPFIRILNGSGTLVLRLLGIHGQGAQQMVHSEQELRILLDDSQENGVLEKQETEIIQRVFDFTDMTARQVMVPRTEMVCLPLHATLDEVIEITTREGYTRYPVYDKDLDNIVGIVKVKHIMPAICGQSKTFSLAEILEAPLIVPEMVHVDDLLTQFRKHKTHLAVLVDEFGGTAGIVTMQDLLEEIVGEVAEGIEDDEMGFEPQADGSVLINGKMALADVNERLGLDLHDPQYVTLGGLAFSQIGRRPRLGDEVPVDRARLRVEQLDGLRVAVVRVTVDE